MNYPLFLSFDLVTIGNGFVAQINARAQVLASAEHDGWWFYGVHPGGMAESGDTIEEAQQRAVETMRLVMIDIASECKSFPEFKACVEQFFAETSDATFADWKAAVDAIRSSGDETLGGLPRIKAEEGFRVNVMDATAQLTPQLNPPPVEIPRRTSHEAADMRLAAAA